MFQNVFKHNFAEKDGGAIKWIEKEPFLDKTNIFENNTALYGNNLASFPFRIILEGANNSSYQCNSKINFCFFSFKNIVSGALFDLQLDFLLKDIYNQTILSAENEY